MIIPKIPNKNEDLRFFIRGFPLQKSELHNHIRNHLHNLSSPGGKNQEKPVSLE
jgi:hypothetical protein